MSTLYLAKNLLRSCRDTLYLAGGCGYDAWRFVRHSGIWGARDASRRAFKAAKIYHKLEKSLSFRERKATSGWAAASDLVRLLTAYRAPDEAFSFQERVGVKVLGEFVATAQPTQEAHGRVAAFFERHAQVLDPQVPGGAQAVTAADLRAGMLEDPEGFFRSRHSVRDFKQVPVPDALVARALTLAAKTPSVCNRQGWFAYHLAARADIDKALSLQNGNAGFGHEIPCLLVIAADLHAFDTSRERYQPWIDGGMFAMSVALAFHALGLATCCLNWDQGPLNDLRLRALVPLEDRHTVIMMMAVGYPSDDLKVCASPRKPLAEFYRRVGAGD